VLKLAGVDPFESPEAAKAHVAAFGVEPVTAQLGELSYALWVAPERVAATLASLDGGEPEPEAILFAAATHQVEVLETLLENGASLRLRSRCPRLVGEAFGDGNGTAFDAAVAAGDVAVLKLLLESEVVEDTAVCHALLTAVRVNDVNCAKLLVASGADVELRFDCDRSPLCEALFFSANAIARLLLDSGASPVGLHDDFGAVPLALALEQRPLDFGLIEAMLEKLDANKFCGFDEEEVGVVPLEVAIRAGCVAVVQQLLSSGADPRRPLANRKSRVELAEELSSCQDTGIVELLLEAIEELGNRPAAKTVVISVSDTRDEESSSLST
jgi:ankyrin repeat protein